MLYTYSWNRDIEITLTIQNKGLYFAQEQVVTNVQAKNRTNKNTIIKFI